MRRGIGPNPRWLRLYKKTLDPDKHRGKTVWRHRKIATHKLRREASEETNPANILTPELRKQKFCGLHHPAHAICYSSPSKRT